LISGPRQIRDEFIAEAESIKTKISSSYNTKIIANNINIIDKW